MSTGTLFPPSLVLGASMTMTGNFVTEYEYQSRPKLVESIIVSIIGGFLTALSIFVAEKIEGDTEKPVPLKKKIEAVVLSSIVTFIVSIAAEKSGATKTMQAFLVGLSAAIVWIFVHFYLF